MIALVYGTISFFLFFFGLFFQDIFIIGSSLVAAIVDFLLFTMGAEDSSGMTILSVFVFLTNIVIVIYRINNSIKEARMLQKEEEKERKIAFYERCKNLKIKNCDSDKNKAKSQLIAAELGFEDIEDIVEFFYECRQLKNDKDEEIEKERIDEIIEEEIKQKDQLEEYAFFTGRDKRVAILDVQRIYYLQKAALIKEGQLQLIRDSQQAETDWAIHGGIASGLAGGAVGALTAMDIQSKNAVVRAQNKANLTSLAPTILASYEHSEYCRDAAEDLEYQIREAKTKLVADISDEELIEKLTFTDKKISVSESGTVKIDVSIAMPEELIIFDDVPAIIDGTIIANIFDGEEKIGSCYMVLPTYGVDKKKEKITGMCLTCGKKGEKYTVEFEALHLWAMER